MKLTRVLAGYTIVEVMIVLSVTGVLFIMAMLMVNGQQERTEFTQAARNLESQIQDVMNDVSTGHYVKNTNLQCAATPSGPVVTASATDTQGTNAGCTYLGRAIQFTNGSTYRHLSLVGLRQITAGTTTRETTNIVEAQMEALAPAGGGDTTPDDSSSFNLPPGMGIRWVRYDTGVVHDIGSIVFLSEQASYSSSSNLLQSQARKRINLVPVRATRLNHSLFQTVTHINSIDTAQITPGRLPIDMNPPGGVSLCMDSSIGRHAIITIGGTDRPSGTDLVINLGACPS